MATTNDEELQALRDEYLALVAVDILLHGQKKPYEWFVEWVDKHISAGMKEPIQTVLETKRRRVMK